MTKEIVLSDHARQQIDERELTEDVVIAIVENPEQVVASGQRRIAQTPVPVGEDIYLLRVVYEETDTITVVTVYRTSKIAKYWRTE